MRLFRRPPDGSAVERFRAAYSADPGAVGPSAWSAADTVALLGSEPEAFTDFVATAARSSFEDGLLRCLLPGGHPGLIDWNGPGGWRADWPDVPRLVAWAYDWVGRLWCLDLDRRVRGEPMVVRFEPGQVQWNDTRMRFAEFIGKELIDGREDLLSEAYYRDWRAQGGAAPKPDQCVGFRHPLFLGGEDDIPNLEVADLMVYVSITGQLATQVADLPPGTPIDSIKLR